MIRVIVELWPGGVRTHRRTIGIMDIGNVSDLADRSDYEVHVQEAANPITWTRQRSGTARILGHDRRQSVWRLLAAAISALDGAEYDDD